MTIIQAACPDCGKVEFGVSAIVIVGAMVGSSGTYRFECPCCERSVHRSAELEIIELLMLAGVPVVPARCTPVESLHPSAVHLPAFTERDIEAFMRRLDSADCFAELEGGAGDR